MNSISFLIDLLAALKLRIPRRKAAVVSAYAPQCYCPYSEHCNFFNKPKYLLGDLNARLYDGRPGEDTIIGNFFFKNCSRFLHPELNRFLFMEFCSSCPLHIANTNFDASAAKTNAFTEHRALAL